FAHHVEFVMRSGETEQELREATTATAYLSDLKSQMATALAREFQGPIKTVLGFAELIRREVYGPLVPSTYRDLAGDMATATQQLNASLLKLMDFGRTLTANLDVKSETLRIGDLISDAMSALEHNALRRDVAIDVNLQIPADLTLCADRALLIQAIRAVIGNAVNMSPRGSRVEISAALDEDGQFNLWARDRGPDIPTSLLAEINETDRKRAMLQRQPTESREIGIKIAKILTEAHQGRLDARSDQSGGNVVRLELPRERVLGGTDVPTPQSRENERARLAAVSAALAADPRLAALTTMPSATITTSTPSRPR
ncbi:MAG: sensor histidine kinase, partial [Hyphomicrobium sp.]